MASSIALVVLDTLRKDAFDRHFQWLDGRAFENAYSTSHWTTPAHGSMFAGAYPSEVGTHAKHLTLDTPFRTIAEKLQDAGWTCRGYSANGNVSQSTDFDRGFDEFTAKGYHSSADIFDWQRFIAAHSDEGLERFPRAVLECVRSDCDTIPSLRRGVRRKYDGVRYGGSPNLTVEDALEYVTDTTFGEQEFLFLNLMEAHSGYTPPAEYQSVEPVTLSSIDALEAVLAPDQADVDETGIEQTYEDSVRYLSDYYRKIHRRLLDEFDYVITVSDHGETFGEDGIHGHVPSLHPHLTHVPLAITGNVDSEKTADAVSILDVHQTIVSTADVEDAHRGQDLLAPGSRHCVAEAHGLSEWQRRELRGRGLSDRSLEQVEGVRRGIALDDYYGYDAVFDGWTEPWGSDCDGQALLESAVADFAETSEREAQVSGGVRSQLRDMGYI